MGFTVIVPEETQTPAFTRAMGDDTAIENMDLFVFDSGTGLFIERRQATDIVVGNINSTTGGAEYTFTARLRTTPNPCVIYFVANARTAGDSDRLNFGNINLETATQLDVMSSMRTKELSTSAVDEAEMVPIIMWGKIGLEAITSESQPVERIKLLRTVAAISVKEAAAATLENGLLDFTINSVSAGNIASSVYVAPDNWDNWDNANPDIPDFVMGTSPSIVKHFGTSIGTGYWSPANQLHYVNESSGTRPYIIVHATYKSVQYFYKIVLLQSGTSSPIDFVRNHRYIVNITSVSGPGYQTLAQAVTGEPSNGVIESFTDTHEELVSFVADSRHYMGISRDEVWLIYGGGQYPTEELAYVFATRRTPTAIFQGTGLPSGNLSVTLDAQKGLWKITGQPTATGNGTITVSDGVLEMKINVSVFSTDDWQSPVGGGGSFYTPSGDIKPDASKWRMDLLPGSLNVFLSTTSGNQPSPTPANSGTNWGQWGVTSATQTVPELYIFVPSGVGQGRDKPFSGKISYTYTDSEGITFNGHLMINGRSPQ